MSTARRGVGVLLGAAAIALGARLSFPLPGIDLPQTAQTLAVLLVGAALGARSGGLAVVLYVAGGALGLPIFADGKAGLDTVLGPSSGYLLGFIAAAVLVGAAADRDRLRRPRWSAVAMPLAGHGVLLLLGGALLVPQIGVTAAWTDGIAPFLLGAIVKSGLAAAAVMVAGPRWPLRLSAETDAPRP
ncbi:MAG: biotin transporter BioY [Myxococcota bacterium]